MNNLILHIFVYFNVIQALFLALHFLTLKKPNLSGNKLLGFLLLSFATSIFSQQILIDIPNLNLFQKNYLYIVHLLLSSSMYILLFFYAKTVNREKITSKLVSQHTLMVIAYFYFCLAILKQVPTPVQDNLNINITASPVKVPLYFFYLILIFFKLLKGYRLLPSQKNPNLSFLLVLAGGFIFLWSMEFILLLSTQLGILKVLLNLMTFIFIAAPFIFINAILMMALKKPEIFYINQNNSTWSMKEEEQSNYLNGFIELMEKEKVYKDSELTLNKISEQLQINPKYLSLILNKQLHCSFPHIINKYRIETSKELLKTDRDMTIQQIMYDVGYNSKSAFNSHFKRMTGYTPSEYKIKYSKNYHLTK